MIDDPTADWNQFRAKCQGIRGAGAPLDLVLARVGLPAFEDVTRERFERVRGPTLWARMWAAGYELTGDPWLAARTGLSIPFGAYELVDYAASAYATVGESAVQLARLLRLVTPDVALAVHENALGGRMIVTPMMADPTYREISASFLTGILLSRYRGATSDVDGRSPFVASQMTFEAAPRPAPCPFDGYVKGPITFGQGQTELVFSRDVWRLPLVGSSSGLAAVLGRHADDVLARRGLAEGPVEPIRGAIRAELTRGSTAMTAVAKRLGVSARTLQRQLQSSGVTFQSVLDGERERLACARLASRDDSVGEIAFLLGYSEQTAFLRAFRRWTGVTPTAYRNRARESAFTPTEVRSKAG